MSLLSGGTRLATAFTTAQPHGLIAVPPDRGDPPAATQRLSGRRLLFVCHVELFHGRGQGCFHRRVRERDQGRTVGALDEFHGEAAAQAAGACSGAPTELWSTFWRCGHPPEHEDPPPRRPYEGADWLTTETALEAMFHIYCPQAPQ